MCIIWLHIRLGIMTLIPDNVHHLLYLYLSISVYSIYLSIYRSIYLAIYLSFSLSMYISVYRYRIYLSTISVFIYHLSIANDYSDFDLLFLRKLKSAYDRLLVEKRIRQTSWPEIQSVWCHWFDAGPVFSVFVYKKLDVFRMIVCCLHLCIDK